jgi:hypothetical protein
MTISTLKIKLFSNTATMYRVLNAAGEVVQVFDNRAEAEAFINA